ncbi:tRNA lysidine(34) synthetase TilS [Galbibacter sp. EGI 63066]|uniref:tRNA lysidine(34) synthetase TilS n=1 Tax=Galbibacter sp. EGI 63066 TaxID=2993559 RepID=UPI0022492FED|nr:tRNA lysidine(34) synthetase TilS [Galbibacter sp. EGI 63066]MCX2681483.1 tRNA lysidine(34) synthetase TilS [Galbibacter sp. EGI 63066]
MLNAFKEHIEQQFPFLKPSKLMIAVSGGIDSMVLTHLCHQLGMDVVVLHCDFQLRGQASDEDEQFIKQKAGEMKIPFYSTVFDTENYAETHKLSTQLAARELRYRWFREQKEALNYDYLLTAHHADDNLETFLINLSRGTGLDGLTGIPEINDYVVRPLLPFSREGILQYALNNKIEWREDSSNAETKYLRNKLRHEVIPKLKEINPTLLQNFESTINHLKGSSQLIERRVEKLRNKLFEKEGETFKISVKKIQKLKPKQAYLYELFKPYGFRKDIEDIENLLEAQSGKQLFSDTHRLLKDREFILVEPLDGKPFNVSYFIEEGQNLVKEPFKLSIGFVGKISEADNSTIYLDKETLKFPLKLRKWENGDYFYPFGMKGRKKVSKYFKDQKFSLIAKEKQWLLCNGDDKIIWIVGHRTDDRFKVTETTKQILKIEYFDT